MEGQLPMDDFMALGLSYGTAMDFGNNYDDAPRNAHKRPWPFPTAADDQPLSLDRPSPSVRQSDEPLYLLGSVSCVGPVYVC